MHHNGATAAGAPAGNVNGVGLRRANGPVASANGIVSPAPSKLLELSRTFNRFYYGGKNNTIRGLQARKIWLSRF
jgi:hypothetical protein